jgi:hypothetical protein
MRKFIKDIVTGVDGTTYDAARVFMAAGCGAMLAGAGAAIWRGTFDFVAFGGGFGGLLIGAGGAIWLKRDTEPCRRENGE